MDKRLFDWIQKTTKKTANEPASSTDAAVSGQKKKFDRPWLKYFFAVLLAAFVLLLSNYDFIYKNLRYAVSPESFVSQPAVLKPEEKMIPNILKVPSLDIAVPVVYVNENSEKAFQEGLAYGVVHYPRTAMPGQPGNPYIFGHSSDFVWAKGDYKTVFALLPKIKIGAQIIISDPEGNAYRYEVIKVFVAEATDLSVLSQGDYKEKLLTLQTSYPVGTALRRFIVVAQIVD